MRDQIRELRQDRRKIVEELRTLRDRAKKENRDLTTEEEEKFDRMRADAEEKGKKADKLERKMSREAFLEEAADDLEGTEERKTDPSDPASEPLRFATRTEQRLEEFASEFRENMRRTYRTNGDLTKEVEARLSPEYESMFGKFMRGATGFDESETRAVHQAGIDLSGGELLAPPAFVARLIKRMDDEVFVRRFSSTFVVTGTGGLGAVSLEKDPEDAEWTSELKPGSEANLEFGGRELDPQDLAKRVILSAKLLRRSALPVEQIAIQRLAYKFGITHEKAFLVGHGASQPLGVFTPSKFGIDKDRDISEGNTNNKVKFDGLKAAKWKLKAGYLRNAIWIGSRELFKQIDLEKDAEGRYIWQPSVREGEPDRLLSRPIYPSEFAPSSFTPGSYVAILGDFRNGYWIADEVDFRVQRLVEKYAPSVGLHAHASTDAMPVLPEAFVRVQLAE